MTMKNNTIKFLFSFILNLSVILSTQANIVKNDHKVDLDIDGINISIDPRIELLSAIQLLSKSYSKSPLISKFDHEYKKNMATYFAPFNQHPAIKQFDSLVEKGFSFGRPVSAILILDNGFDIDKSLQFSQDALTNRYHEKDVKLFLTLAKEFANESKFKHFYNNNMTLYQALIEKTAQQINGRSQIKKLEAFYGETKLSYNIVLAPNFHDGGFGPNIFTMQGKEHVYSVNGPTSMYDGIPDFGDVEHTLELVNHEFSHSFLKQVFELNKDRISLTSFLLEPIKHKMKKQGYSNWFYVLNEHVVRGVTIALAYEQSKELGNKALTYEKSKDYNYIDTILLSINNYQNKRDIYPTFSSYFSDILNSIEKIKKPEILEL